MPRRESHLGFPGVPIVTLAFASMILICFAVQLAQAAQMSPGIRGSEAPIAELLAIDPHRFRWYTLVTHTLPHGGWMHLVFNLLGLAFFGPAIEARLGRPGYAALVVFGAVAAGATHVAMSHAPAIGASGAVAAIAGAFLIFFPTAPVCIAYAVTPIPAWVLIGVYVAKDLFHAGTRAGIQTGVANWAHLGGYGAGILLAAVLLVTHRVPRDEHDVVSLFERRRRRLAFRASVARAEQDSAAVRASLDDSSASELVAHARSRVVSLLVAKDLAGAARAYAELVDLAGGRAGLALPRAHQSELAAHLLKSGDQRLAARAYEQYAQAYADEPDAAQARLLVALLASRSLNQPERARAALEGLERRLRTVEDVQLCRELAAELHASARAITPPTP